MFVVSTVTPEQEVHMSVEQGIIIKFMSREGVKTYQNFVSTNCTVCWKKRFQRPNYITGTKKIPVVDTYNYCKNPYTPNVEKHQ